MSIKQTTDWYKKAVIYQIYPRSFCDSNGDGIGDIQGIISKADYLEDLGINTIWISPFYKSPKIDGGYDIEDYCSVDEEYGTLEDFKALLKTYHSKGIRVITDLVINHTSDRHAWFKESRKSKNNPYRDFYIWRDKSYVDAHQGLGEFNQSQWEYTAETDSYYFHTFSKEQPELNWENPLLRSKIHEMIRFWMDLGVDGFRCDVIYLISKDPENPAGPNRPRLHEFLHELYEQCFSLKDCITIAELWGYSPEKMLPLIAKEREELTLAFQFDHLSRGRKNGRKYERGDFCPNDFIGDLAKWQNEINGKAWNTLVLENHDQPRSLSRFGSPQYPKESAKLLAAACFLMQGTAFIYQGQELGLANPIINSRSTINDIETIGYYHRYKTELSPDALYKRIQFGSRDNARVGMPWDNSPHFGFTSGKPWNDLPCNYESTNAAAEQNDSTSVLHFYRKLIHIKIHDERFSLGDFQLLYNVDSLFVYQRKYQNQNAFVIGNFSDSAVSLCLCDALADLKNCSNIILSNYADAALKPVLHLRPYETIVAE